MAAASTEVGGRTTERERPLHILTVNVNGLKTNGKGLIEELEKLKSENREVDVLFLTETRIGDADALTNFKTNWEIFFTCNDSRSKGAAILVNKERAFRCLDEIVDESGRYVILSCFISETFCTFVSVHHHPEGSGILNELSEKIKPLYTEILVVGGDFNTALDEKKDRTSTSDNPGHNRIRKELLSFMGKHDLKDAWRDKNPPTNTRRMDKNKKYTHKYTQKETYELHYSRLDYFFINADKRNLVQDCRINDREISDHRSVSLMLDLKDQTRELKIVSCTVHDLPRDEDLTELCPDIILLTKGEAEHEKYINKIKEEEGKTNWTVLWSDHSNAAILVTKRRRDIHILFTVYKEDCVILHCRVFGMFHTFVSVCHLEGTQENLQNMLQEITPSYSGTKVIGGIFSTSGQIKKKLMNEYKFHESADRSMQLASSIPAQLTQIYKIEKQEKFLFLIFTEMNVDDLIRSLGQLKIHH
ncbi:uncharacterized protein LOC125740606 isoform X4 [Brienomyrus brachyistius]|uniref:uncharacterized protein LOC125740606 isoform X3 n=1 Tax=Brienomyrus brachyistius TaxID=42636 RepID=UPI0020B3C173|nr:uncharacterized protein LOC125740606 isoform X3 [Brienomyrus brachyistius]XP_048867954.1 uncharacterized protein LOC125740606 isoform X4 [Brienomyrus brachyistius]XP_048867956.1 uncharacterized protein LOC125740606 isoform X4 [Brienomyrus brachyistius]